MAVSLEPPDLPRVARAFHGRATPDFEPPTAVASESIGPLPAWHVERPRKSPKWPRLAFVVRDFLGEARGGEGEREGKNFLGFAMRARDTLENIASRNARSVVVHTNVYMPRVFVFCFILLSLAFARTVTGI